MKLLLKNQQWLALLVICFLILGCGHKMTYEQFVVRFQQQCPDYYLVRDLVTQEKIAACDCMLKTTQQNYPNMASLLAGMRAHDREPRGETDYVPSAIRIAAKNCIDK